MADNDLAKLDPRMLPANQRTYSQGGAMLADSIRGMSERLFGPADYVGTPNDPGYGVPLQVQSGASGSWGAPEAGRGASGSWGEPQAAVDVAPELAPPFTASQMRPGVTEISTPLTRKKGTRFFTNLIESGATPQQIANFEETMGQPGLNVVSADALDTRLGGGSGRGDGYDIETGQTMKDIVTPFRGGDWKDAAAWMQGLGAAGKLAQEDQAQSGKRFNRAMQRGELALKAEEVMNARLGAQAKAAGAAGAGYDDLVASQSADARGEQQVLIHDKTGRYGTFSIPAKVMQSPQFNAILREYEASGMRGGAALRAAWDRTLADQAAKEAGENK
jgi:hypothetical protein